MAATVTVTAALANCQVKLLELLMIGIIRTSVHFFELIGCIHAFWQSYSRIASLCGQLT